MKKIILKSIAELLRVASAAILAAIGLTTSGCVFPINL